MGCSESRERKLPELAKSLVGLWSKLRTTNGSPLICNGHYGKWNRSNEGVTWQALHSFIKANKENQAWKEITTTFLQQLYIVESQAIEILEKNQKQEGNTKQKEKYIQNTQYWKELKTHLAEFAVKKNEEKKNEKIDLSLGNVEVNATDGDDGRTRLGRRILFLQQHKEVVIERLFQATRKQSTEPTKKAQPNLLPIRPNMIEVRNQRSLWPNPNEKEPGTISATLWEIFPVHQRLLSASDSEKKKDEWVVMIKHLVEHLISYLLFGEVRAWSEPLMNLAVTLDVTGQSSDVLQKMKIIPSPSTIRREMEKIKQVQPSSTTTDKLDSVVLLTVDNIDITRRNDVRQSTVMNFIGAQHHIADSWQSVHFEERKDLKRQGDQAKMQKVIEWMNVDLKVRFICDVIAAQGNNEHDGRLRIRNKSFRHRSKGSCVIVYW
jgi:hypothetical protein